MALKVERRLRFAWMEYEDHRDAVMMHHTFSSGKLGWRNLFLDLPSARTSERVNVLSQFIVGEPSGVLQKIVNGLFSRPLKLPTDRVSHKHAFLNIVWLQYSLKNKNTKGLIMTPAANVQELLDLNTGVLNQDLTPDMKHDLNELLNESNHQFLGRWLLNPGVRKESESMGYLTYESDFTDQADLVVASGHGGGGNVFGSMGGSRSYAFFAISKIMRENIGMATTGRVKYLLVPGCANCNDFSGSYWLPLLQKPLPYHGVLGYSGKYSGDDPGAAIIRRFTELIQQNVDLPIVEAWKRANAGQPYGAFVLNAALGDTMRKWVSKAGLTVPDGSTAVTYFDPSTPNGKPSVMYQDLDAIFHMADGREIAEPNNTMDATAKKQFGLFPGKKGQLSIKGSMAKPLVAGRKIRIVFYNWRPTKLRVNLPKLLKFDEFGGKLKPLTDQNKPGIPFDKPQPSNVVDAVEYVITGADVAGFKLDYTVVPDAHENKDFHAEAPGVFGRIHVGIAWEDATGKFEPYMQIYTRGAFLGSP